MADFEDESNSEALRKCGCDECGSSDANVQYSNGSAYCFSCKKFSVWDDAMYKESKGSKAKPASQDDDEDSQESFDRGRKDLERPSTNGTWTKHYDAAQEKPITARGITMETCEFFGVRIGKNEFNETVHMYPYFDKKGQLKAVKTRDANKDFAIMGDGKGLRFFGQHKFKDGGSKVVVTEGEIDALSMAQLQGLKWPVVSLPAGATSGERSFKQNLEWLESYETVIICFDMDEPGRQAAAECAAVLSPGKAKIMEMPMKDANEMLLANRGKELIDCMWNARTYRPDGILGGDTLWDLVSKGDAFETIPYPWPELNEKTGGIRTGELITVVAGTGVGKSNIMREIAYHIAQKYDQNVGLMFLEESIKRTSLGMMGIEANRPLHVSRQGISNDELKSYYDKTLGTGRYFLFDHFGSTDVDNLLAKVRYLAKGLDCKYIILDHLSIVVSGLDHGAGGERAMIDKAMTMLRTLVQETGICLFVISHLNRGSEGPSFEEGGRPSLNNLRGSHSIAQLSDAVLALVRDQQGENPNSTEVIVLKNRFTGQTGYGCTVEYDPTTGRLKAAKQILTEKQVKAKLKKLAQREELAKKVDGIVTEGKLLAAAVETEASIDEPDDSPF